MKLRDLLVAFRRRWYLALVGIAATVALGVFAFQQAPPTYAATGSALLLPPSTLFEQGDNPYLALSGLGPAMDVLVKYLDADAARGEIAKVARTAKYTIGPDLTTNGPIVVVTAKDTTRAGSLAAMRAVLNAIPPALGKLQASVKVPAAAEITSMTLAVQIKPTTVVAGTVRAVVAAAGGGLLVTAYSVALLDGYLRRRRARTQAVQRQQARQEEQAPERAPVSEDEASHAPTGLELGDPDLPDSDLALKRFAPDGHRHVEQKEEIGKSAPPSPDKIRSR